MGIVCLVWFGVLRFIIGREFRFILNYSILFLMFFFWSMLYFLFGYLVGLGVSLCMLDIIVVLIFVIKVRCYFFFGV